MPNCAMPKRSTTRSGSTSASSVMVCTRSSLRLFVACGKCLLRKFAGPSLRWEGPRLLLIGRLEEQPHQTCECCYSGAGELREREHRGAADHRERHRGVRLCLAILTRERRDERFESPSDVLHYETPCFRCCWLA